MRYVMYALTFGAVMSISNTQAAACKGQDAAACKADACTWVAGYQRKDGRQVQGYCRAKPAGASKAGPLTTAKTK